MAVDTDGEWEALAEQLAAPPFVRPGWVRAWCRAFGRPLETVAVRGEGGVAGVAPVDPRRWAVRSPTNWHTPLFALLADSPEARAELVRTLLSSGHRAVEVAFVEAEGPDAQAIRDEAVPRRWRLQERVIQRAPYVALEDTWDSYRSRLPGRFRRELRRRRRRLGELGSVDVRVHDGTEHLHALLREGFAVEAAGWKGARGTAVASRADTRRLYTQAAVWAAERGWLRLAFLSLDGRPIAFDYGMEHAGVHYLIKTGFDPAYARFAPGALLREDMIRRAFAGHLRSYELLGTEEPWKMQWADRHHVRVAVHAFSPGPVGRSLRLASTLHHGVPGRSLSRARSRMTRTLTAEGELSLRQAGTALRRRG